jgi:hypothetical protein
MVIMSTVMMFVIKTVLMLSNLEKMVEASAWPVAEALSLGRQWPGEYWYRVNWLLLCKMRIKISCLYYTVQS